MTLRPSRIASRARASRPSWRRILAPRHRLAGGGDDQIFAEQVLEARGALTAVIPSAGYAATFQTVASRALYRNLLGRAAEVIELPFPGASEMTVL